MRRRSACSNGQGDGVTGRRGDAETGRHGDTETESDSETYQHSSHERRNARTASRFLFQESLRTPHPLRVSLSPRLPVSPSPRLPVFARHPPINSLVSTLFGSPRTTKRMLRMYFCATRCTSWAVTARKRGRKTKALRQPPPMISYCASSPA